MNIDQETPQRKNRYRPPHQLTVRLSDDDRGKLDRIRARLQTETLASTHVSINEDIVYLIRAFSL